MSYNSLYLLFYAIIGEGAPHRDRKKDLALAFVARFLASVPESKPTAAAYDIVPSSQTTPYRTIPIYLPPLLIVPIGG